MKVDDPKFSKVDDEDIDDVVGIASEMMLADEDDLDRADMIAVGRDLDIPEEYLDRAHAELMRRRKEERRAKRREEGRLRRLLILGGAGIAGVIFITISWAFFALNSLSRAHADVQAKRGQVENVLERQESVEERWGSRPDTPDKMAAVDGAENRVRVETKRYLEAAADYNAKAERFPNSLFLNFSSLPDRVPQSAPKD